MKILNAGHYYHVKGGSDRYMVELAELLSCHGDDVVPFAVQDDENILTPYSEYFPNKTNTDKPGISDLIRYNYSFEARSSLKKLLSKTKIDVAHLHIYYGQLTTSVLGILEKAEIPIVQTLHEYKLTCPVYTHISGDSICEKCQGKRFSHVVRNKCKGGSVLSSVAVALEASISRAMGDVSKIDHFIAPSEFMRQKMVSQGVIPEDKITKLGYHIDTDKYRPSSMQGDYLLYFGRLAQVKGISTLLEAIAGTSIPLVIAGTGPLEQEVMSRISSGELKNVSYVGFKAGDELFELVNRSVCTVLPSEWYDNLPLAVLESMACGKPVIGARIGGIPEMITDGVDGILCDSGSSNQFRNAMKLLWADRGLAAEMGRLAREKMKLQYNPVDHLKEIKKVYATVM